jgi:hypothetical protein
MEVGPLGWAVIYGGRATGVGSYFQDALKHFACRLGLDSCQVGFHALCITEPVAPAHPCARDIPFILNITPASGRRRALLTETIDPSFGTAQRVCSTFLQDLYVQDERYFAIEHRDVRREASLRPHRVHVS